MEEARLIFRTFSRDRRGSVSILFAVALVPLLVVGGAAIEYSRSTRLQADLQSAVDGAALTAGRNTLDKGRRDPAKLAREAFDAAFRLDGGITVTRFMVTQSSDRIAVEAAATLPTIFGGFLGKRVVDLGAKAEVPLGIMALEVALVLDNTGSMSRLGKMDALKEAAKNLLDTIQGASRKRELELRAGAVQHPGERRDGQQHRVLAALHAARRSRAEPRRHDRRLDRLRRRPRPARGRP